MTSSQELWRNIAIIVAIAAAVWLLPGGDDGTDLVLAFFSAAFIVVAALIGGRMYQQFKDEIFSVGDDYRLIGYVAVGAIVVTLAASDRLFETPGGTFLWLGLLGGAGVMIYLVVQRYRAYDY